ncbi:MAG TPA: amino acid adenylation domain-containing protein, partial [Thermomicrobiales bacterium]|nr:amino acid adenylation domain-containing protein [Thermomicrobiales bacterium]
MAVDRGAAERRPELSPAQRAWLEERIRAGGLAAGAGAAIPRRPDPTAVVPLSPAQQRLWFIEKLRPGTTVHTVPMAFRLLGDLDTGALERSLAEIVRRHEALRTTVSELDGVPVQVVRPAAFTLPIDAFNKRMREAFGDHLDEYVRLRVLEEVRRPFDLVAGPLVRARLLRLAARDHVLILTAHHLVIDGWSIGVIRRELASLYAAFTGGEPSRLAEPPIQYADYALWQHERLRRGALDAEVAYWSRHLAGLEPSRLPIASPHSAEGAPRGGRRAVAIPPPLAERLRDLARREGVTLYMALLAAYQAVLARYTERSDIAVASPIAGRNRLETEGVVGFFVNTLVLRTDLDGDPTFRALLGRVRTVALDAFAHQEAPFDRVVAAARPERGGDQRPLVSVAFALHNTPRAPLDLPGLSVSQLEIDPEDAPFDLSLGVRATERGLHGWLDYDADAFDAGAIDRFAGHFRTLLNGAVGDPDRALSALPLLTPPERNQLLVAWNPEVVPIPADRTIHGLFEAQAARTPEAIAVVGEGESLTFGELNRRANRLAHRLRQLGLGRDAVVGLCLEPSPVLIVGMVAALKAGGAYLPLDPADPPTRLAALLAAARARAVIAPADQDLGPPVAGRQRVSPDGEPAAPADLDANPDTATGAEDLAYVAYTSGSSGQPKGVMVPHLAVVRLVIGNDYVNLTPDDVVAQAANPAFDATTFEVWGALLNDARLEPLPREVVLSPRDLAAEVHRRGVTTLFLTTALFQAVVAEAPGSLRGLRHLLFGGEAADPSAVAAVLREGPPERLVHVYGPTEATTFATWQLVERVEPEASTIPIGRPIANTAVYVLDQHRRPVPVGVPGELYIGGPGVARGYLHQPRLSAERFLPDPFAADPAARRFRTGDRVRWREDGTLEFLGRLDDQVKLRDFRAAPGEVEAALRRQPRVRDAAVVVTASATGSKHLVAYVTPRHGSAPDVEEVREGLKAA